MFAQVDKNKNIKVITRYRNYRAPTGVRFTDLRLIDKETLVENGIYHFIPASMAPNSFSKLKHDGYFIDDIEGTITEQVSWELEPLDVIQDKILKKIQDQEISRLKSTDWMVLRKFETGEDLDPKWAKYRSDIRAASKAAQEEIKKAKKGQTAANFKVEWPQDPYSLEEENQKEIINDSSA